MRPDMICPIRRDERKYLESQGLGLVEIQASEWIVRPSPLTIWPGVKKVHKKCVAGSGGRCRGIRGGVIGMLITLGTWITARTHPFMRSSQSCKLGSWPWSLVLILESQQHRSWSITPHSWRGFLFWSPLEKCLESETATHTKIKSSFIFDSLLWKAFPWTKEILWDDLCPGCSNNSGSCILCIMCHNLSP